MSSSHICGPSIRVDGIVRQRCLWCGELLFEVDYDEIAARPPVAAWGGGYITPTLPVPFEVNALISVDANGKRALLPHPSDDITPPDCCTRATHRQRALPAQRGSFLLPDPSPFAGRKP